MKKLIAVLLSVCLFLGVCATSFAAGSNKASKDSQKFLNLLAIDDEADAEETIGSILEALLAEDETEAADETADEAEGEDFLGDIISKVNTGLALYIMDKDAEDEGLNIIIAALISYWTKDAEPLRNAIKYARENYEFSDEVKAIVEPLYSLMDVFAADIENDEDGFNSFPLLVAGLFDNLFSEDAGFAILPAVLSLEIFDEDPENEYEELGFWLFAYIASYLDYLNNEDDVNLLSVLLGGLVEIAKSADFEDVTEKDIEEFVEEYVMAEDAEGVLAYLLGLYD